jgi:hypothetical protein
VSFGIRVPGVRISTRGVRVGPRFANVGVSTRGRVSGSVGPRIARVSASSSGVRVGTGVGRVRLSAGSSGVRIGAGVGPVFGSVGRSGVIVGAGLGPIWAAKRVGGSSRNNSTSSGQASSRNRMDLSKEYQSYKTELVKSGSSRRNRDELRIAAVNALLAPVDYLAAPFEIFGKPKPIFPQTSDLERWARNYAIQELIENGLITERLKDIHDEPTKEAILHSVEKKLKKEGVVRPPHPALEMGFIERRMPNQAEVTSWATAEVERKSGFIKRFILRSRLSLEIVELETYITELLESQIEHWEKETTNFDSVLEQRCQERVIEIKKIRNQQLSDRKPIDDAIENAVLAIRVKQDTAIQTANLAYEKFVEGQTTYMTLVLQAVLSDNSGTAAPLGVDDGDVLVVMTAPNSSEVIWPERIEINSNLTVRKKTKAEFDNEYFLYLLCHTLAAAREVITTSDLINRVRVVVLDEKDNEAVLFDRRVVAALNISRAELSDFPGKLLDASLWEGGIRRVDRWREVLAEGKVEKILARLDVIEQGGLAAETKFLKNIYNVLIPIEEHFTSYLGVARANRPRFVEMTEDKANTTDELQIIESEEAELLASLDLAADEVLRPDFWVLCQLLAENWDADEIDIESLKHDITIAVQPLYPMEDADVRWPNERS